MAERVLIGMSGGVDSSVAAYLLKEQGYDVIGVTMQMWDAGSGGGDGASGGMSAARDAERVAKVLGIPHYVLDFRQEFRKTVIDYFAEEYLRGRTPNPCVVCNHYVKWEALLQRGKELGADLVATGHYARLERMRNTVFQNGGKQVRERVLLRRAATAAKDQTYALYHLSQDQLVHTIFPLGDLEKEEVRKIAASASLPVADKPDSQEICFIPDGDYGAYLEEKLGERAPGPGKYVDRNGEELGTHQGIIHYTIGQRRGLGIPAGKRIYVTGIRPEKNEVVLGENADLFVNRVVFSHLNLISLDALPEQLQVVAKIRYNHRGDRAVIRPLGEDLAECIFEHPVRAATPGQSLVFYDGDYVAGGGIIEYGEKIENG